MIEEIREPAIYPGGFGQTNEDDCKTSHLTLIDGIWYPGKIIMYDKALETLPDNGLTFMEEKIYG